MAVLPFYNTVNPQNAPEQEILPQFIPNTATDVVTSSIHLTEIILTNNTAAAVTVTIQDKQATPVLLLDTALIDAFSTYALPMRGRWMPGGVTWSASSANAISASLRGY